MMLPVLCFLPMVGAVAAYCVGRRRVWMMNALSIACTGVVLVLCVLTWQGGEASLPGVCGLGLHLRADGFRSLYASLAAFLWFVTALFSPQYFSHHPSPRYHFFYLMTLGATLGVFLSDDLYTTFVFFEIMSLTSCAWVAQEETPAARRAADTYLAVAVVGGLAMLMGLFLLYRTFGTLSFAALSAAVAARGTSLDVKVASWLVLVGFMAKAGLFPLHIWLPKAHPVAPAPASALLSGMLTKSGVFGVVVVCAHLRFGSAEFANALLVLAAVTMFVGAVLALFSVDLKRVLACSSMSQIGFITVGLAVMVLLGEEGQMAAYGALLHMVNHSLIKLCLFLCAGVVFANLHALDLNVIRGFGRKKPLLHLAFLLGGVSIACIPPLGSGYNSKSLLHEGVLELIAHVKLHGGTWQGYKALEVLFLISGGLTVAYMTKLYLCLFWERNADAALQDKYDACRRYLTPLSAAALVASSAALPLLGLLPGLLMTPLAARSMPFFGQEPLPHAVHYFSAENLLGAAQSMAIGAAVYLLVVRPLLMPRQGETRVYADRWPRWLDLEELLYRPLLAALAAVVGWICSRLSALPESAPVRRWVPGGALAATRFFAELPERLVWRLRRGILRKKTTQEGVPVGNRVTYALGRMLNRLATTLNKTLLRHKPMRTDFEYVLDASRQVLAQNAAAITRSVSFGLLLVGIGLLAVCGYLLLYGG